MKNLLTISAAIVAIASFVINWLVLPREASAQERTLTLFGSVKGESVPDGYAELAFNFFDKDREVLAYRSISTAVVEDGTYTASLRADDLTEGKEYYVLVTMPNVVPESLQDQQREAIGVVLLQSETPGIQQTGHVNISGTLIAGAIKTNAIKTDAFRMPTGAAAGSVLTSDASGNGTWQALPPPSGAAGGDLFGTYPNPLVDGLQGYAVSSTAPATGQVLKWNGSAWSPGTDLQDAFWQASGNDIFYNAGNVGIGVSSPAYRLHAATGTGDRAIYGLHSATSGITYGVYGQSDSTWGMGVYGSANATSDANFGVYGRSYSTSGTGVYGLASASSGTNYGVIGKSGSTSGYGVMGHATAESGTNYGVYGVSDSTSGRGVFGWANATSGTNYGVYGRSDSPEGYGGYFVGRGYFSGNIGIGTTIPTNLLHLQGAGTNSGGVGGFAEVVLRARNTNATSHTALSVDAQTAQDAILYLAENGGAQWDIRSEAATDTFDVRYQVGGANATLFTIDSSGNVGVGTSSPAYRLHVEMGTGDRTVFGHHTATSGLATGVYGQSDSTSGFGVVGFAPSTSGFAYGGYFESASTSGRGVVGKATAASGTTYGVYGRSDSPDGMGVYGWATATSGLTSGVYGQSDSGASGSGVYGLATATSGFAYGGFFRSASTDGRGVEGLTTASSGTTYGVFGLSYSTSGTGVFGSADASSGVTYGGSFESYSTSGRGVFGIAYAASGLTYGGLFQSASTSGAGVAASAIAGSGLNYGVYSQSSSANGYGVYGWKPAGGSGYGVYYANGLAGTGTKSFQMDHPLMPETHYLNHFCTEGPEPYNTYRGNVVTDAKGYATIPLPPYFESINRDPTYHLTVIDDSDEFVLAKVVRKIKNNQFVIRTSKPNVEVSWEVKAIRNDLWVQKYGFKTEQEKPEKHQGKYLHPELYGMPEEYGIHYRPDVEGRKGSVRKVETRRVSEKPLATHSNPRRVSFQKTH